MREQAYNLKNVLLMRVAVVLGILAMVIAKTCEGKCGAFVFYEEEIPKSLVKKNS